MKQSKLISTFRQEEFNLELHDDGYKNEIHDFIKQMLKYIEINTGGSIRENPDKPVEITISIPKKTIEEPRNLLNIVINYLIDDTEYESILKFPYINKFNKISEDSSVVRQIVDKSTFVIKTSLKVKSVYGRTLSINKKQNVLYSAINKNINAILFIFYKIGFFEGLDFLGLEYEYFEDTITQDIDEDNYHKFVMGKNGILFIKKDSVFEQKNIYMLNTLKDALSSLSSKRIKLSLEDMVNKVVTTNYGSEGKMKFESESYTAFMDDMTKMMMYDISDDDKKTEVHLVRFLLFKYHTLMSKSKKSLSSKRIRLIEYLLMPVSKRFNNTLYRTNSSTATTQRKINAIKFQSQDILMESLLKSKMIRHKSPNVLTMFELLKVTQTGDGGLNNISLEYREPDISYIDYISLVHASAKDPGVLMMLTPYCKLSDNQQTFVPEQQYESIDSILDTKV